MAKELPRFIENCTQCPYIRVKYGQAYGKPYNYYICGLQEARRGSPSQLGRDEVIVKGEVGLAGNQDFRQKYPDWCPLEDLNLFSRMF